MNKLILSGLLGVIPGLGLAIFFDYFLKHHSEMWALLDKYHVRDQFPLGGVFGPNPYIYHFVGLCLGFLLFSIFRLTIRGRLRSRIWAVTNLACAGALFLFGDMLLIITIFSLGPAEMIWERLLKADGSVDASRKEI